MGKLSENKEKNQMGEVFNKVKSAFVLPEKLAYILAFIGISLRYCRMILSNIKNAISSGILKGQIWRCSVQLI